MMTTKPTLTAGNYFIASLTSNKKECTFCRKLYAYGCQQEMAKHIVGG